jgi:hypothetical protein
MNLIFAAYAALFGFFVGLFLAGAIGRWAYAVWTTVRARHVGGSEHKTRPLIWALPLVFFLHSTPWLLAIVGYLTYQLLSRAYAPEWRWFFGGIGVSLISMVAFGLLTWRRVSLSAARRQSVDNAA